MIVRQLCVRQSRQLLALNRARVFSRFNSIDAPVKTEVQTPSRSPSAEAEGVRPVEGATQVEGLQSENTVQAEIIQVESIQTEATSQPGNNTQPILESARAAWRKKTVQKHKFHGLGSAVQKEYNPEDILRYPPQPSDITLELLLASQTHLGHSTSRWNPQNSRYIFGIRDGIHIISLDVTAAYLRRAAKVVEEVAARGGLILFVGTRDGQKRAVVRAAELAKGYHVFERWIPGSLTNGQQILGRCQTKVVNAFDEELPHYQGNLADRAAIKPDLVVCFNPIENAVLLHECGLNNVPTIGIIDTDADPTRVTYPIPANDDSLRGVSVIAGILGNAGAAGQRRRLEAARNGVLSYEPITVKELTSDPLTGQQ
ncbi:37S ribosomal protein, mitochondrial [Monascus purpureus]|uniref:37S ribosomal protein, mitochondrial n=1 Tax=Monascus purpureus TaxID=5098 RepID=A0A507R6E7_MONPU|nr:37S ribosomal protein, mitochondrial [Monascus purpureus]